MICKEYAEMLPQERIEYTGKIFHALTNSSEMFKAGQRLIKMAEKLGLFEGVVINPLPNGNETRNEDI